MAPKSAAGTQNAGAPNQTLYVKNLDEKINKKELKRALYMLFSTYGPVLDIVTSRVGAKGQHLRGQAHIVYRDIQTSTQAMRALQGFNFFEKEMVIVYAKGQSSIINKLRGTFEPSSTATTSEQTALQKSIFNAPPPSAVPAKSVENGVKPAEAASTPEPHGTKRPRDEPEEEDDENEVEMEEDEDDVAMEEDDED